MTDDTSAPIEGTTRIVIVGAGYAGAYCAGELERRLGRRIGEDVEVILLDPRNYFVIYPLLIEAGTGSLEPRHTVVSIRSFLRRASFTMGRVMGVDFQTRTVRCQLAGQEDVPDHRLPYDHLVLAPGSTTLMPPIPGLSQHGRQMKSLADAVGLRDRVIRLMEQADATADPATRHRLLHIVVVGASFTGAELAGEFHEFMQRLSRSYPNVEASDCRITLVERSDRILQALSPELSVFAEERMSQRGIEVLTSESATEIADDHVLLASGRRLDASTVMWCAGIAPSPLVGSLDIPVDERGYILCERDCRVQGLDDVWAIGDSAVNIDVDGNPYPATAQHAVREGVHVARQIIACMKGQATVPFDHRNQGSLAALGCRTGVAEVMGLKLSGFWAWWLWRTIYLLKMPGFGRKVRIAVDWTLDLLFRRDDVQLGLHRSDQAGRSG